MSELGNTPQSNMDPRNLTDILRCCLSCGIVSITPDKKIATFNSAAERLTGQSAQDLLHSPISRLPDPLQELAEETIQGASIQGREFVVDHPEHGTTSVTVSTSPLQSTGSEDNGATIVLNELPRELESQTRQLDRLASIGTLSASMAHEIKNALVPVRTFVELLAESNKDNELSGLVGREITRVDSILSQMLSFAGPAKPTFIPVGVHEILEIAINLTRRQIEEKSATLCSTFNANSDRINGDTFQLEAAFMNLIFNALEAVGPGGELDITTDLIPADQVSGSQFSKPRPCIQITFQDNGPGIKPDDMERLFEPFFTTKVEGTGLGLNITNRIIKEHQGSVKVTSEPGKGATFILQFPVITPGEED